MPITTESLKDTEGMKLPSSSPVLIERPEVQFSRSDVQTTDTKAPSFGEAMEAAFKTENSLGSFLAFGPDEGYALEPIESQQLDSFEPMDMIPEKHWQEASSYVHANSPQDVERITARLDEEIGLRKTLAASGWKGMVSTIAAGALDPLLLPLLLLPGANVIATGMKATKAAGQIALSGAAGIGVSEVALHQTQETRTGAESVVNIAGAALLSGVMGGAISKFSKADIKFHGEQIEKEFAEHSDFEPRSVGAAQVATTTLKQEELLTAAGAEKLLQGVNPLLRMSGSPSVESRRLIQGLAESPFYTQKNLAGIKSDVAVETLIKMNDARRGAAYEAMDSAYVEAAHEKRPI